MKIVAGAKRTAVVVPKFEEKIGLVHARLYTTDVASKTKKKRKGFSTAAFREFFGKSSSEQLNKTSQKVPVAPKVSHRLVVHNQALRDDYHYMTQIMSDQAAQEYFALEDTYAQKKTTTELSQYAKVFGREIESLDTSHQMAPAEQVGEYFYYARQEKGRQMAVYCRKKGINGAEEILFDGNAELSKHSQMFLATMKVNIDQSVLL
ncbi:MAG: hypothetical protein J0G29_00520, partial [Alphaproteobacteria bacterium]|nr:hypothetical protein [Alphaproteobacteria bacterium]